MRAVFSAGQLDSAAARSPLGKISDWPQSLRHQCTTGAQFAHPHVVTVGRTTDAGVQHRFCRSWQVTSTLPRLVNPCTSAGLNTGPTASRSLMQCWPDKACHMLTSTTSYPTANCHRALAGSDLQPGVRQAGDGGWHLDDCSADLDPPYCAEENAAKALRKELNDTLEERVNERTQALAEANQQLQHEMLERERIEDTLLHAQKMEAVGQLTGGIAHDFNNMLTGIIASLDLMKRYIAAGRSDEIDRFTDAAVSSAQRAAALTHRLLVFSRRQIVWTVNRGPNVLVNSIQALFNRLSKRERSSAVLELVQSIPGRSSDTGQLETPAQPDYQRP